MNPTSSTPRSILLVEDDACTAVLFKNILQREGYTVQHNLDGEAALQTLWKNRFDAVVLDLMMPKMDGVQVLKAMRSLPDHVNTPVLIVTAARLKMIEDEAQKYGVKLFLDKTQTDKLIAALRQILTESGGVKGAGLRMAPLTPISEDPKPASESSPAVETRPAAARVGGFFQAKSTS